jgi:SagB-type dehydrogenase family enzyme
MPHNWTEALSPSSPVIVFSIVDGPYPEKDIVGWARGMQNTALVSVTRRSQMLFAGPVMLGSMTSCPLCIETSLVPNYHFRTDLQRIEKGVADEHFSCPELLAYLDSFCASLVFYLGSYVFQHLKHGGTISPFGRAYCARLEDRVIKIDSWRIPHCVDPGTCARQNPEVEPAPMASFYHSNSSFSGLEGSDDSVSPNHRFLPSSVFTPDETSDRTRIALPKVGGLDCKFSGLLRSRRSIRSYKPSSISLHKLSALLFAGAGPTGRLRTKSGLAISMRTHPSGGALYPLSVLVIAQSVSGLATGIYLYTDQHSLLQLSSTDYVPLLSHNSGYRDLLLTSSAFIAIAGEFGRSTQKYGERGYRNVLLEAGHLLMNLQLGAAALNLGACCITGFVDRVYDETFGQFRKGINTIALLSVGNIEGSQT